MLRPLLLVAGCLAAPLGAAPVVAPDAAIHEAARAAMASADYATALRLWQGLGSDPVALLNLGKLYEGGWGVPQDYFAAVRHYGRAASAGNTEAQCRVGALTAAGKGTRHSDPEALRVYRLAADAGAACGLLYLGMAYERGMGVLPDATTAVGWYRKAVAKDSVEAMVRLAALLTQGKVKPEPAEAVRLYRTAIERGSVTAEYNLGLTYYNGLALPPDRAEGVRWIGLAAAHGEPDALTFLGQLYLVGTPEVPRDPVVAQRLFLNAAQRGQAEAAYRLGELLLTGSDGVPAAPDAAAQWLHRAAAQDYMLAQSRLGDLYARGLGVPTDPGAAYKWYLLALAHRPAPDNMDGYARLQQSADAVAARLPPQDMAKSRRDALAWRPTS